MKDKFLANLNNLLSFCIDSHIITEHEAQESFSSFCIKHSKSTYDEFEDEELEFVYNSNLIDASPLKALKTAYEIRNTVDKQLLDIMVDELVIIAFADISVL